MQGILAAFDAPSFDWNKLESPSEKIILLGKKQYLEAREIQNHLVEKRKQKLIEDKFIITEHPPTLTLGKRLDIKNLDLSLWSNNRVEVFQTDRGGEMTFHGPGQLVVYPVFDLRDNKLSVSNFIESIFCLLSKSLKEFGINSSCRLNPAGLWVNDAKIASVGLRIDRGVTNHGFSLNISCSLEPFSLFPVCGENQAKITSVLSLTKDASIPNLLVKNLISLFFNYSCR